MCRRKKERKVIVSVIVELYGVVLRMFGGQSKTMAL